MMKDEKLAQDYAHMIILADYNKQGISAKNPESWGGGYFVWLVGCF